MASVRNIANVVWMASSCKIANVGVLTLSDDNKKAEQPERHSGRPDHE